VPDIKHLYNFVTVEESIPTSTILHDSWLTAKVKSQLLTSREVDASNIKVVSEDSTVYLLGLVDKEQAETITDITRKTAGVDRVVTMFEYVHTTLSPVEKTWG
jgi:osmotically-inducible protein OsmY